VSAAGTEPRRGSIALGDGRRVETAWWGPGPEAAPSIVMLHEGLGSVSLWRDAPSRISAATGCGVFAYSRLGYGQSDPVPLPRPLTFMHDEAREVLPRVLDEAGVRRCILLGHSDGASIAAIYAGSHQDFRVRGLILLAPHFFVEASGLAEIAEAERRYEAGDLRDRMARHHRDAEVAFRGWNRAWRDPAFPGVFDLQPEIAHIRVPILIIQGEADRYGTVEHARLAEREAYCPVETLLLPGIGHAPQFEAPDTTLEAVRDFAARLFGLHEAEPYRKDNAGALAQGA
jgi:pimeloyl-ACP methyl ester carboxylesterase